MYLIENLLPKRSRLSIKEHVPYDQIFLSKTENGSLIHVLKAKKNFQEDENSIYKLHGMMLRSEKSSKQKMRKKDPLSMALRNWADSSMKKVEKSALSKIIPSDGGQTDKMRNRQIPLTSLSYLD
jgi:hypothetical protein